MKSRKKKKEECGKGDVGRCSLYFSCFPHFVLFLQGFCRVSFVIFNQSYPALKPFWEVHCWLLNILTIHAVHSECSLDGGFVMIHNILRSIFSYFQLLISFKILSFSVSLSFLSIISLLSFNCKIKLIYFMSS